MNVSIPGWGTAQSMEVCVFSPTGEHVNIANLYYLQPLRQKGDVDTVPRLSLQVKFHFFSSGQITDFNIPTKPLFLSCLLISHYILFSTAVIKKW